VNKLPVSAMVVGYNEAHFLKECFSSIAFCDEIIYTDLGSTDESLNIASDFATSVYHRGKVPSCEMIQAEMINYVKNDWVIFIDPDEKVDPALSKEIGEWFSEFSANDLLGAVKVPWIFYFSGHKLKGTTWGGVNAKFFLVHKERFSFEPVVHYGRKLKPGYSTYEVKLNDTGSNVLHHYWMNSYKVFLKKHLRYLKNEGIDQYKLGFRLGLKTLFLTPFRSFRDSFIIRKGYKDGVKGLFLSAFWSFYKTVIAIDVIRIQMKQKG